MHISIVKGKDTDRIRILRDDGSTAETRFAHKGPFPHDAVHFAVERQLGMNDGFWGMVARGANPEAIGELAKGAGHASAKRAAPPDPAIVELLQAERLVECFEADLWGGGTEPALLRQTAIVACDASFVPMPDLDDDSIIAIRAAIADMALQWREGRLDLEWSPTS